MIATVYNILADAVVVGFICLSIVMVMSYADVNWALAWAVWIATAGLIVQRAGSRNKEKQ